MNFLVCSNLLDQSSHWKYPKPFSSPRKDKYDDFYKKTKLKTKFWTESYTKNISSSLAKKYDDKIEVQQVVNGNKEIKFNTEVIAELPSEFVDLYEEIEESKYILDEFIDEEDEERGKYNLETWKHAIQFIVEYAEFVFDETSDKIHIPKILDGPGGSIDILWRNLDYQLLINIPTDIKSQISLYGKDQKDQEIKMKFFQQDFKNAIKYSICSLQQCGL